MKKILSLKIALLAWIGMIGCYSAIAQPTLNASNHTTVIGESQTYHVADSNAVAYGSVTGASVTWDYSTLEGYGVTSLNDIIDPNTTSYASNFPTADVADDLENSMLMFRENYTDSLVVPGYIITIPGMGDAPVEFSDKLKSIEYPFTYGDSFTDQVSGTVTVFFTPMPYEGTIITEADGYGTLLLGTNTYTNVLRVKSTESSTVDASALGGGVMQIDRIQYVYYEPGTSKFPIFMHTTMSIDGTPSQAVFSRDALPMLSVEDEIASFEFSVYPNPASEKINLSISAQKRGQATIKIINAVGKEIKHISQAVSIGSNAIEIDLFTVPSGIYFVNATINGYQQSKKLIIK